MRDASDEMKLLIHKTISIFSTDYSCKLGGSLTPESISKAELRPAGSSRPWSVLSQSENKLLKVSSPCDLAPRMLQRSALRESGSSHDGSLTRPATGARKGASC